MAATSVKTLNPLLFDLLHIAIPLRLFALSRMPIRPNRLEKLRRDRYFFKKRVSIFGYPEFFLTYRIYPAKCRKNSTFFDFNILKIFV
ncbi:MAG: hypothetical protein C4530_20880 [Desulfobacteraceae bacterium]|nr:MAG: hypothetical protein C4530_20880 [Desulfobacteraceae bacterium]